MSKRIIPSSAAIAACVVATSLSREAVAQTAPSFGISIGIRENATSTTVGQTGTTATGSVFEWVNPAGVQVSADGTYATVTFNFGSDPVGNFTGGNGALNGDYALLEHIRIVNTNGITAPTSMWVDDIVNTPAGGSPVVLNDAQGVASGTANSILREPSFSGSTDQNFARGQANSGTGFTAANTGLVTNVQPDGSVDPALLAARINYRFAIPEAVGPTYGWGRVSTLAPMLNPVIDIRNGSTLSFRVALTVNAENYGYVGYDGVGGNNNWLNNDNWGSRAEGAPVINTPNNTNHTALFNEVVPVGEPVTPRTVNLDATTKAQLVQFKTAVPYTITGTGTLNVARSSTAVYPTISVEQGNQTIDVPVLFSAYSNETTPITPETGVNADWLPTVWVSPNASLSITKPVTVERYLTAAGGTLQQSLDKRGGGTLNMIDAPYTTVRAIGGTLNLAPVTNGAMGTLAVSAGATANVSPTNASTTTLPTGTIAAGGQLSLSPTAAGNVTATTLTLATSTNPNGGGKVTFAPSSGGVASATTVTLNNNTALVFNPTGNSTASITTISVPGTLATISGSPDPSSTFRATTTNIGAGATLKLDLTGLNAFTVNTLGINATGKLDLTNDGVLVDYTPAVEPDPANAPFVAIRNRIIEAYGGGTWAGASGITSSLLPANGNYAIGYRELLAGETFMGKTAADGSVAAIRYTLQGDSDLNGTVNFDDLLALARNYDGSYDPIANGPKLWADNDSDYNGIVNFDDLLAVARNYNGSVAAAEGLAASIGGAFEADFALAQSLVPEPTTLGLLGGAITLLGRRRRA